LTWRDAQHLTVHCAHVANLKAEDWAVNGVGRNYSHNFGYGIMDATCMVRLAKKWKNVAEQKACKVSADNLDLIIPGRSASKTQLQFKGCEGVKILEHVQVKYDWI
jgi:furin